MPINKSTKLAQKIRAFFHRFLLKVLSIIEIDSKLYGEVFIKRVFEETKPFKVSATRF